MTKHPPLKFQSIPIFLSRSSLVTITENVEKWISLKEGVYFGGQNENILFKNKHTNLDPKYTGLSLIQSGAQKGVKISQQKSSLTKFYQ